MYRHRPAEEHVSAAKSTVSRPSRSKDVMPWPSRPRTTPRRHRHGFSNIIPRSRYHAWLIILHSPKNDFQENKGSSGFRVLSWFLGALPPNPRGLSLCAKSMIGSRGRLFPPGRHGPPGDARGLLRQCQDTGTAESAHHPSILCYWCKAETLLRTPALGRARIREVRENRMSPKKDHDVGRLPCVSLFRLFSFLSAMVISVAVA